MVMGANIGTSVTNTVVSLTQVRSTRNKDNLLLKIYFSIHCCPYRIPDRQRGRIRTRLLLRRPPRHLQLAGSHSPPPARGIHRIPLQAHKVSTVHQNNQISYYFINTRIPQFLTLCYKCDAIRDPLRGWIEADKLSQDRCRADIGRSNSDRQEGDS